MMARISTCPILKIIVTISFTVFASGNELADMIQMAKYHHTGLERTLRDLRAHVDTLSDISAENNFPAAKALEDLSSLTQSVNAFCLTFQQTSKYNHTTTTSTTSEVKTKPGWYTPSAALVPLAVKVKRYDGKSNVEFKVRQFSSGYIEPTLAARYMEQIPRKTLRMRSSNFTPRIITASLELDTEDYCSTNHSNEGIGFSFASKNRRDPTFDVLVDVCTNKTERKGDDDSSNKECVGNLFPTSFSFKYGPDKERVVANPGENSTLTFELHFSTTHWGDLRPSTEPIFYVTTFAYNRDTGSMTTSYSLIYKRIRVGGSIVEVRYMQTYPRENSEELFTTITEIIPDKEETPELLASKERMVSRNMTAAFVRLDFETANGDRSALVLIEQIKFCPFNQASTTRSVLPIRVLQKGQRHHIPRGFIEFLPKRYYSCYTECIVQCIALGYGITEMTVTKQGEQTPGPQDLMVKRTSMGTTATLYLGKTEQHFAGTYECRAKNTIGYVAVHLITLSVDVQFEK